MGVFDTIFHHHNTRGDPPLAFGCRLCRFPLGQYGLQTKELLYEFAAECDGDEDMRDFMLTQRGLFTVRGPQAPLLIPFTGLVELIGVCPTCKEGDSHCSSVWTEWHMHMEVGVPGKVDQVRWNRDSGEWDRKDVTPW